MYHLPRFLEELPSREGAHAIYIEPPTIAHVRVSNVQGDENGIRAMIDVIPKDGMINDGQPSFEIFARWDTLSNTCDHWHAIYVNWSVYFKPEQVKKGLELAAKAAAERSQVQLRDMRAAMEDLGRRKTPRQ
jgi:hypothetical protein